MVFEGLDFVARCTSRCVVVLSYSRRPPRLVARMDLREGPFRWSHATWAPCMKRSNCSAPAGPSPAVASWSRMLQTLLLGLRSMGSGGEVPCEASLVCVGPTWSRLGWDGVSACQGTAGALGQRMNLNAICFDFDSVSDDIRKRALWSLAQLQLIEKRRRNGNCCLCMSCSPAVDLMTLNETELAAWTMIPRRIFERDSNVASCC